MLPKYEKQADFGTIQQFAMHRPQHANALLAQPFFQYLDFQLRPVQFAFELCDAGLGISDAHEEALW
jgi:hypothetical protein